MIAIATTTAVTTITTTEFNMASTIPAVSKESSGYGALAGDHGAHTTSTSHGGGQSLVQAHEQDNLAADGQYQHRPTEHRKFGNPAPLGLSAFALTTFVLSLINMRARKVHTPNIVVAAAYGYGGLVQLLAGMW